MLIRVVARNFVCGLIVDNETRMIVDSAPIMGKFIGQPIEHAWRWAKRNGVDMHKVTDD